MTRGSRSLEDVSSRAVHDIGSLQKQSLLLPNYSALATARPTIAHSQLRHLLSCPQRRGIVYYTSDYSIVERDLLNPHAPPRTIFKLDFRPLCLAATAIPSNSNQILFAAGGHCSDIHLSLHNFPPAPAQPPHIYTPPKLVWKHVTRLRNNLNSVNYIFFTPAALTDDMRAIDDMRVVVSGNDKFVKFLDVALPVLPAHVRDHARMQPCGAVRLETCVNHVSMSPNGRTLLCVGDTPKAYLFHISPGPRLTFVPVATYTLPSPPPTAIPAMDLTISSVDCFATAWSGDGFRFAVASQEGQLCVWDVRSAEPLYTFWTSRPLDGKDLDVGDGVMRFEDWMDDSPDSGIRSVQFSTGKGGRELLVWAEHTTNIHVIDARTFDPATHAVVPFPDLLHLVPARVPSPPTFVHPPEDAMRSVEIAPHATDKQETAHAIAEAEAGTRIEHTDNTATPPHVNIAGICVDPSGGWVYVAGEQGIVEWQVRGRN